MLRETTVPVIADLLRHRQEGDPKACLLIGAGVSFTAGIGLAKDFIERIRQEYPAIHAKACQDCEAGGEPNYAQCMAALPPARQVQLVRTDIDAAKINWAHVGIARMERQGIIDTILTPNFDPLASRACALFNRFPAIYDLAGLRDEDNKQISFDKSFVKGSAIFHLHGQHTGFLLLNTEEKLLAQAKRIRPVLDAVMKGKPVIIAGYSGENDPLIDEIAALAPFNHGLFWVCHDGVDPALNVCEKLLSKADCHIVRNMPGDRFFTELANALKLDAPGFLATPFDHMLDVLGTIRPYGDVGDGAGEDLLVEANRQLEAAREQQAAARPEQVTIAKLMATGQYDEVWRLYGGSGQSLDDADQDLVAWAATMIGSALSVQAKAEHGATADALFAQAYEKFSAALTIKPNKSESLYNWGIALAEHAKIKEGGVAEELFARACEKYAAASSIKPFDTDVINNWGVALSRQAILKQGQASDALFLQAGERFAAILAIEPDNHGALHNWGIALSRQAMTKAGATADGLFAQADEKFSAALTIKPDRQDTFDNWGNSQLAHAKLKRGKAANVLLLKARQAFEKADEIEPGRSTYNIACAFALQGNAKMASIMLKRAKALAINWPGCEHVFADTDFDKVRESPEFKEALVEIGCMPTIPNQ